MAVQKLAICTICSNNYVPMAKVLLQSARAQHPEATFYLCLADERLPDAGFYPADCEVIVAADLAIPDFKKFAFRYDVLEFNTAVKPFLLLALVARGHDAVLYFDPDIEVFAPLEEVFHALDDGASFVLTPHLLRPAEGDCDPDDVGIMRAGIYNLGFLGVGVTAEAKTILAWWARRLRYQCVSDQGGGLFVDQRFFDLVPGFADGVRILRDTRYNVAYWNLPQRDLTQNGVGWLVDGQKLGFFHFSGFDCGNLGRLSKHTTAFRGNGIDAALLALMRHYAEKVKANGYRTARSIPYAYGRFDSGAAISSDVRRLFRAQNGHGSADPFADFEEQVPTLDPDLLPPLSADELTRQVAAMHASTSWRITSPLRAVGRFLKGERHSV